MIIVHAELPVRPEMKAEVEARGEQFAATCTAEDGCIAYVLSWKFGHEATLRLVENWESLDAYEAHTAQPHVEEWAAWIPSRAAGPLDGTRYNVDVVEPQTS
ncbi:antibiotic biosynthesis monooxygenase [Microbacter sp. GSS18]|nr:antibiotic biosynthesis monooxygenase [Microbacter sp. GSS18]